MDDSVDFADLMDIAQRNNEDNQISCQVKRYNLEFNGKKKTSADGGVDQRAIQRVIAQKKREEIKKRVEEQRKKERLMAERSQNRKAKGMISSMLKRTKSAMKGVVAQEEALAAVANDQLEADDFGYTSTYADKLHASLLKKYEEMPVSDKYSKKSRPTMNMEATKARMRQALEEEEEEAQSGRRRRKKEHHDSDHGGDDSSPDISPVKSISKPPERVKDVDRHKKRLSSKPQPPPITFAELLNMAEAKVKEPVKAKPDDGKPKKEYEFDRPMTAKEKEEFLREQQAKLRREGKLPRIPKKTPAPAAAPRNPPQPSTSSGTKPATAEVARKPQPIPKIAEKPKPAVPTSSKVVEKKPVAESKPIPKKPTMPPPSASKAPLTKGSAPKPQVPSKAGPSSSSSSSAKSVAGKKDAPPPYVPKRVTEEYVPKPVTGAYVPKAVAGPLSKTSVLKAPTTTNKAPKVDPKTVKAPSALQGKKPITSGAASSSSVSRPSSSAGSGSKPPPPSKPFPSNPKPGEKRPAGATDPWSRLAAERGVGNPAKKAKPAPPARRRIESDSEEEEYDSEMDDFIDDGPLDGEVDVSSEISRLFGYDRRRYATLDEDDDDECMEASFGEQLKEEFRSTKAGILEDLREARLQKAQKKKMMQKAKK